MLNKVLATLAYEVAQTVGDTSSSFLTKVKIFLNDRYSDCLMRTGITVWSLISQAELGNTDIPQLGLGEVIKKGALSDAWNEKRQFLKGTVYEDKFNNAMANFIISYPYTRFNLSFSRYDYHEE